MPGDMYLALASCPISNMLGRLFGCRMYRKSLPGMLPDFKRGVKASSREHAAFKQQEEQKIRQAQADEKLREAAGELKDLESPETSAWANEPLARFLFAPSRDLGANPGRRLPGRCRRGPGNQERVNWPKQQRLSWHNESDGHQSAPQWFENACWFKDVGPQHFQAKCAAERVQAERPAERVQAERATERFHAECAEESISKGCVYKAGTT